VTPGIDVPAMTARIHQVPCGTQKNPCHMHQLAEGEVDNQKTHKKEMNIKE
jgi:hypothetical protein